MYWGPDSFQVRVQSAAGQPNTDDYSKYYTIEFIQVDHNGTPPGILLQGYRGGGDYDDFITQEIKGLVGVNAQNEGNYYLNKCTVKYDDVDIRIIYYFDDGVVDPNQFYISAKKKPTTNPQPTQQNSTDHSNVYLYNQLVFSADYTPNKIYLKLKPEYINQGSAGDPNQQGYITLIDNLDDSIDIFTDKLQELLIKEFVTANVDKCHLDGNNIISTKLDVLQDKDFPIAPSTLCIAVNTENNYQQTGGGMIGGGSRNQLQYAGDDLTTREYLNWKLKYNH